MRTNKKKSLLFLVSIGVCGTIAINGCKKSNVEAVDTNQIVANKPPVANFFKDLKKIAELGFDPLSTQITPQGYLVEGDILLTAKNLDESLTALSKQQGQYSTRYPLSLERKIKVGLDNPTNSSVFKEAFTMSLKEMNSLKIPLNFIAEADTSKAEIIVKYEDLGGAKDGKVTLGRAAEFVNAEGNPGRYIKFNSNSDADLANAPSTYLASILSHEFGHTIGMRHTDYKNRMYSEILGAGRSPSKSLQQSVLENAIRKFVDTKYGTGIWDSLPADEKEADRKMFLEMIGNNEGDLVGGTAEAKHIYGTPLSPTFGGSEITDPLSLMLANITSNQHFSLYDNIAFFGLYGNPAQTAHIRKSLDEYGKVTTSGKTLTQIVSEVKALKQF